MCDDELPAGWVFVKREQLIRQLRKDAKVAGVELTVLHGARQGWSLRRARRWPSRAEVAALGPGVSPPDHERVDAS